MRLLSFELTCCATLLPQWANHHHTHFFDLISPLSLCDDGTSLQSVPPVLANIPILWSLSLCCDLLPHSDYSHSPALVTPWGQPISSSTPPPDRSYRLPGKMICQVEGFPWKFMTTSPLWALHTPSSCHYILQNISYFQHLLIFLHPLLSNTLSCRCQPWLLSNKIEAPSSSLQQSYTPTCPYILL